MFCVANIFSQAVATLTTYGWVTSITIANYRGSMRFYYRNWTEFSYHLGLFRVIHRPIVTVYITGNTSTFLSTSVIILSPFLLLVGQMPHTRMVFLCLAPSSQSGRTVLPDVQKSSKTSSCTDRLQISWFLLQYIMALTAG